MPRYFTIGEAADYFGVSVDTIRDKKDDLERQANALIAYCENQGWQPELIKDIGSGLNYEKQP